MQVDLEAGAVRTVVVNPVLWDQMAYGVWVRACAFAAGEGRPGSLLTQDWLLAALESPDPCGVDIGVAMGLDPSVAMAVPRQAPEKAEYCRRVPTLDLMAAVEARARAGTRRARVVDIFAEVLEREEDLDVIDALAEEGRLAAARAVIEHCVYQLHGVAGELTLKPTYTLCFGFHPWVTTVKLTLGTFHGQYLIELTDFDTGVPCAPDGHKRPSLWAGAFTTGAIDVLSGAMVNATERGAQWVDSRDLLQSAVGLSAVPVQIAPAAFAEISASSPAEPFDLVYRVLERLVRVAVSEWVERSVRPTAMVVGMLEAPDSAARALCRLAGVDPDVVLTELGEAGETDPE